ncbi:Protein of unknown function [Gryllus bimaculatus]|nr:Protein of unknown function [Gryllus bimaculatus]
MFLPVGEEAKRPSGTRDAQGAWRGCGGAANCGWIEEKGEVAKEYVKIVKEEETEVEVKDKENDNKEVGRRVILWKKEAGDAKVEKEEGGTEVKDEFEAKEREAEEGEDEEGQIQQLANIPDKVQGDEFSLKKQTDFTSSNTSADNIECAEICVALSKITRDLLRGIRHHGSCLPLRCAALRCVAVALRGVRVAAPRPRLVGVPPRAGEPWEVSSRRVSPPLPAPETTHRPHRSRAEPRRRPARPAPSRARPASSTPFPRRPCRPADLVADLRTPDAPRTPRVPTVRQRPGTEPDGPSLKSRAAGSTLGLPKNRHGASVIVKDTDRQHNIYPKESSDYMFYSPFFFLLLALFGVFGPSAWRGARSADAGRRRRRLIYCGGAAPGSAQGHRFFNDSPARMWPTPSSPRRAAAAAGAQTRVLIGSLVTRAISPCALPTPAPPRPPASPAARLAPPAAHPARRARWRNRSRLPPPETRHRPFADQRVSRRRPRSGAKGGSSEEKLLVCACGFGSAPLAANAVRRPDRAQCALRSGPCAWARARARVAVSTVAGRPGERSPRSALGGRPYRFLSPDTRPGASLGAARPPTIPPKGPPSAACKIKPFFILYDLGCEALIADKKRR